MDAIEFKGVTKSYGSRPVVQDVSFTIPEGHLTGIIGRNGVGKTTIMKCIAGFIEHSSGEIKVFNENPFNSLTVSANTIFIDDSMSFSNTLTLEEVLQEGRRFYANWDTGLAHRLFTYFGFPKNASHGTLSKGKKSTFNAVVGLAAHCPLTIFDEPTTGMDASVRKDFYRALLKDYIAHPRTILLSSHHLEEIEDLLEDILLIHDQKIKFHGATTELQETFIKLIGPRQVLKAFTTNKPVYDSHLVGSRSELVVDNNLTADQKSILSEQDVRFEPVPASDAYIYYTNKQTGGIDDVFNRTAAD